MSQTEKDLLNYTFEGKEPWEVVKVVSHPHWATLISPILKLLFLWGLVAVLFYYFKASWVTGYAILAALGITTLYGARQMFLWFNTLTIITDHRVLQVFQRSLTNREVAATMWGNVTSVTVFTPGVFPSLFGFGDIVCDPGGSEQTVTLYSVPNVYRVQQMILSLMRDAQDESIAGSFRERSFRRQQRKKIVMD